MFWSFILFIIIDILMTLTLLDSYSSVQIKGLVSDRVEPYVFRYIPKLKHDADKILQSLYTYVIKLNPHQPVNFYSIWCVKE